MREEEEEAWGGLGGATVVSGGTVSGEWQAGGDGRWWLPVVGEEVVMASKRVEEKEESVLDGSLQETES